MPTITVAFIVEVDSTEATINSVAEWLRNKKIEPLVFYTQPLSVINRLTIIGEMDNYAAGYTARRLRKLKGVSRLEYLVPKKYSFRPPPPGVIESLQPDL